MNFEEAGACGINKRKFEITMSDLESRQYAAFVEWLKGQGQDVAGAVIPWKEDAEGDERLAEESEDFFGPLFKRLDGLCDDIPDEADFKPLVEEMTDEMAAYFES
jgi:hypothetical protein